MFEPNEQQLIFLGYLVTLFPLAFQFLKFAWVQVVVRIVALFKVELGPLSNDLLQRVLVGLAVLGLLLLGPLPVIATFPAPAEFSMGYVLQVLGWAQYSVMQIGGAIVGIQLMYTYVWKRFVFDSGIPVVKNIGNKSISQQATAITKEI